MGKTFTVITGFRELLWLMSYDGYNHSVRRLQLEMLGYWFTIVNRPGHILEDANYFSILNKNTYIDPLLKYIYNTLVSYIHNTHQTLMNCHQTI